MTFKGDWVHEEIEEDIVFSFKVEKTLQKARSPYQSISLVQTDTFGKVLLLDRKVQSAENDEHIYHELLVHPALLNHPNPRTVFICGGGEGATAREVLRHKSVEQVVMVDIDEAVCNFCQTHLEANFDAFNDKRLELIHDDAGKALEKMDMKFDVIIADLADPVVGGPCYQLYTKEFYEGVVKSKLKDGGIFVTQSGPAGVLSSGLVYAPIHNTLKAVFPNVIPYAQHVPSFTDTWGWNMAFTDPNQSSLTAEELGVRIAEQMDGNLKFLDTISWRSASSLNKIVRSQLKRESHVLTVDAPKFIHGQGINSHK